MLPRTVATTPPSIHTRPRRALRAVARAAAGAGLGLGACAGGPPAPAAPAPLTAELAAWRDHILPRPEELAWQGIAWRPSFAEGLRDADRLDRPLLLWVMNGHPLGCT